jgi:hypothetical protein
LDKIDAALIEACQRKRLREAALITGRVDEPKNGCLNFPPAS